MGVSPERLNQFLKQFFSRQLEVVWHGYVKLGCKLRLLCCIPLVLPSGCGRLSDLLCFAGYCCTDMNVVLEVRVRLAVC